MASDTLTRCIETVDLPGLVARLWPESGARPGRAGVCRAVWRGDRNPSLSLFVARGMWFWKDHATGKSGNAFHLLLAAGLSREEAAELIKEAARCTPRRALATPQASRSLPEPAHGLSNREKAALRAAQLRLDEETIRGRGITLEQARRVGLGRSRKGDLVIPILGPSGEIQAIKVRLKEPKDYRYRYLTPGRGAPTWFSPGFGPGDDPLSGRAGPVHPGDGRPVLVVEGELNAMAAWFALKGEADVLGIPGVEGHVPWGHLEGRKVYLLADGDEAGWEALTRWREEARQAGVAAFPLLPLAEGLDACEHAERYGQRALSEALWSRMK